MTAQRNVLIVQARNLGDAVISTALVETVAHGLPGAKIDVLTRPEIAQIFTNNPHVREVLTGRFPMSSLHDFGWKEALALPRLLGGLRRRGYTDVVNLMGDFREELLGLVVTHKENWSPAWAADHPCRQAVRPSRVRLANRPVPIPKTQPNIHDAAASLGAAVTGAPARKPALYTPARKKFVWEPLERAVGLHPMASQPWRRWELSKWSGVAEALIERGLHVHVFGAPSETEELAEHFGHLDASRVSIRTGSLTSYFAAVARMRVLLCPDSSASHVAYALGVPTILLNGANDAEAWAPPGTTVLAAGPGLSCYPCYNRPTCFSSSGEYACVRRIRSDSVLDAVWEMLESTSESGTPE